MDNITIGAILSSVLNTYVIAQSYDVVWEDTGYDPVVDQIYLEAYYLPGEPVRGLSGNENIVGIYQININVPAEQGRGSSLAIADEIKAAYGRTAYLSGKGRVGITTTYLDAKQNDGQWLTEVLNIVWQI